MRHLGDDDWSDITENQEKILAFIEKRSEKGLPPPTRGEIAEHLKFKSANAAQEHLELLERKGRIKLLPGIARGITLVKP